MLTYSVLAQNFDFKRTFSKLNYSAFIHTFVLMKASKQGKWNLLVRKLKNEHAFWSFEDPDPGLINDELLIEKVMIHLDLDDINLLFKLYRKDFIRKVWEENLVIQEPYYHGLNRFFAWFYFGIENPDEYLKNQSKKLIIARLG